MRNRTTCPNPPAAADNLASEILALIGRDRRCWLRRRAWVTCFAQAIEKQLLDCAARLGLKGVSKLSREDLAGRIEVAFAGLAAAAAGDTPSWSRRRDACGNGGGRSRRSSTSAPATKPSRCLRTSPGATATTASPAMVVDPARLYVYWEVTDDAIAAARAGLGAERRARLAEPARLRHHGPAVRRHQRAQLLRPPRRTPRTAVVLRASTSRRPPRASRSASSRRKATSSRSRAPGASSFRAASPSAAAASSGSACAAPAVRSAAATRATPGGGGARARRRARPRAGGGGGPGRRRRRADAERVAGLDARARGFPVPRGQRAVRADLARARKAHRAVDQRVGADRVGRPGAAHRVGVGSVHVSRSTSPRAASRSRTTARSRSARKAGARTSCTGRGRSSSAASARAPSGACSGPGSTGGRSRSRAASSASTTRRRLRARAARNG